MSTRVADDAAYMPRVMILDVVECSRRKEGARWVNAKSCLSLVHSSDADPRQKHDTMTMSMQ